MIRCDIVKGKPAQQVRLCISALYFAASLIHITYNNINIKYCFVWIFSEFPFLVFLRVVEMCILMYSFYAFLFVHILAPLTIL